MNEVLAPILFVFANDPQAVGWAEHAEADAFFCFTALMAELRDHFIQVMLRAGPHRRAPRPACPSISHNQELPPTGPGQC